MTTRCKFECISVTKKKGWDKSFAFVYDAELIAVYANSEENKAFWAATPSGKLNVATVKADVFEPGKTYYIDITEAD